MSIVVQSENEIKFKFKISFDVYGNMYLNGDEFKNSEYFSSNNQDMIYQININGNSTPCVEQGSYDTVENPDKKISSFIMLNKPYTLKTKIRESLKEYELDSDEEYDLDGDNDTDYYPEDNDHKGNEDELNELSDEVIDEENIKCYGNNNKKFIFSKNQHVGDLQIDVDYRKNGEIMALYDVYIYDNDLIFKSVSPDNSSIFRIRVFTSGDFYVRTIGDQEKKYQLKIDKDGSIKFIC
jgi:hypothetical protein